MLKRTGVFRKLGLLTLVLVFFFGLSSPVVNAEEVKMEIVSDPSVSWSSDGTTWEPAVACWVHPSWETISGANWIWTSYLVDSIDKCGPFMFRKTFNVPDNGTDITGFVYITTDNTYKIYFNGQFIGQDDNWRITETYALIPRRGLNEILIEAVNNATHGIEPFGNPGGLLFKATIIYEIPKQVNIDIKPGSFSNPVNLKSKGNIPVVVLSDLTFDATAVDPKTVVFAGANALSIGQTPQDVNGDGLSDMVFHFRTEDLKICTSDIKTCLGGKTFDGCRFEGWDSIFVIK